MEKRSPSIIRPHRENYARVRRHVEHLLEELQKAEVSLGASAMQLGRDVLDFRGTRRSLVQLEKTLGEIECDCALIISPSLRTQAERRLASKSRSRLKHLTLPLRENSAELNYRATEAVEKEVLRVGRGRIPSNHIDRFISGFFAAAGLCNSITEENVRIMRRRIKQKGALSKGLR